MSDLPVFRRLRRLWAAFAIVVIAILATLPVLDAEPSSVPVALPATLAVAGGIAALIAIVAIAGTFAASPPVNDTQALKEYEARQTLGYAIAQAPAVLGFALALVFGTLVPAGIGGVFAFLALVRTRPSLTNLEALERTWQAAGHDVSAIRAASQRSADDRSEDADPTQPSDPSSPDPAEDDGPDSEP